ncbi:hypothetical protein K491DRAFT_208639 [Lophiostoma macrostomum CBS 122681]|uniref:JmjC domain-containing histone demethylation protein 1 n=1 Tax=Lophiostoma macrostomum CBS 122681 TaxID=1314788 RepID=A0A6A6SQN6_9PLEO|nr:hypothetical protein K491DRAFT_208639 [Lophiostoma macrostomum CBS 122681]
MRVSSFKAQYRQAPLRSGTPPPPPYEPLSPVLRPLAPSEARPAADAHTTDAYASNGFGSGSAIQHTPEREQTRRVPAPIIPPAVAYGPPLRSAPVSLANPPYSPALGSPIDALADAAVSSLQAGPAPLNSSRHLSHAHASPLTAYPRSRPSDRGSRHAPREAAFHPYGERPSKRARSEAFPSPQHSQFYSRPTTSHASGWSYNVEQMVDTGMRLYQDNTLPQPQHEDNEAKRLSDAQLLLDFHHAVTALQPAPQPHIPTAEGWNVVHPEISSPHTKHAIPETSAEYAETLYSTHAHLDHAPHITEYNKPDVSDPPLKSSPPQNGVATAVQTHTPPEDSLGAVPSPLENEVPNGEDKKTKKQPGSQKGKSRVSRAGATASRKKKSTPKSKTAQSAIAPGAPDQLQSPQSLPAESLDVFQAEESQHSSSVEQTNHAFTTRARRHSYTNIHSPQIPDFQPYPSLLRAQSVPLEPAMTIPLPTFTQRRRSKAAAKELEQATICAGCHSSDSVTSIGDGEQWISCDGCKEWFHYSCAGFKSEREVREVDKFYCEACKPKFGDTTRVRKSTRAHTAVDYAGLNEGILKTSDDNPEHHYIQAFKNGDIELTPETFARLPPECATADFIDKMNGFKEPLVIPAALNPRPTAPTTSLSSSSSQSAGPLESSDTPEDQFGYEMMPDDGQDKIDMIIPEGLTVRRVAELYGLSETVPVIDVKAQEGEDKRWTMAKWADYYEQAGEKPVRNVISLEVSRSRLGRLIRRPKVVRDMDLQDSVWPEDEKSRAPPVQFYCLMSVADCYTDFHIDFGGSSVYYHIVKGKKTFFFIPPTKQNLKKYEDWCLSPTQGHEFLGKQVKECYRVDLSPGDTMLIPSGWIHAVWTPEDSLVIGGNYLTRIHYGTQIKVVEIEKNTKVAPKFRYPFFQKIMWLTVIKYLEEDPLPPTVEELLLSGGQFERGVPIYCETDDFGHNSKLGLENYNRRYYPKGETEGLPDLVNFIWRTVMISQGKIEGVTQTSRNAVARSIPKSHGEPSILARRFAMWVAWKRGNECIPSWAQLDSPFPETEDPNGDKTLASTPSKGTERETWADALKLVRGGERHSSLRARASEPSAEGQLVPALPITGFLRPSREHITTPKTSQLGPKRIACDACRKRRIRCKHKDDLIETSKSGGSAQSTGAGVFPAVSSPPNSLGLLAARRRGDIDIASAPLPPPLTDYDVEGTINGGPVSTELNTDALAQGRSGRMKACADCRKSKRRCIHDENGNIDPVKASETPVPRGSASKKRPLSGEDDGEALNKKIKRDSFAGLVNGEISPWNRYPLQTAHSARASEPSEAPTLYAAQPTTSRTQSDPQLPIDPQLYGSGNMSINGDVQFGNAPQETIVASIEPHQDDPMPDVNSTPIDPQLMDHLPQTPAPPPELDQATPHGGFILYSPLSAAAQSVSPGQALGLSPNLTRFPKMSVTPRAGPSGQGRRDSKGSIKTKAKSDLQPRASSSVEMNEEDTASLALALQLQMEEHGLRRRSK